MIYISVALACLYAVSATAKRTELRALERYLLPVFAARAKLVSRAAVLAEVVLAAGLIVGAVVPSLRAIGGVASAAFIATATGCHALVLAHTEVARCQCFGRVSQHTGRVDRAWHPPLFALRNGILLAVSVIIAGGSTLFAAAAAAASALAVGAGLTVSIRRQRAILARDRHPALESYAPAMRILAAHTWWLEGRPRPF